MSWRRKQALVEGLTAIQLAALKWLWIFWARAKQLAPEWAWRVWFICAGRGFGKTRTGAEWIIQMALENPGCRIALAGKTLTDVRDTMIEGESGILACSPPWFQPEWRPGLKKLYWPNGSMAAVYSGEEPKHVRGPQHHFGWLDEFAYFKHLRRFWKDFRKGLRLKKLPNGARVRPRCLITTTGRPLPLLHEIATKDTTAFVQGATLENRANLDEDTVDELYADYGGTREGDQELDGALLDVLTGALWNQQLIDAQTVDEFVCDPKTGLPKGVRVRRAFVAIDPAEEDKQQNDETGLVLVIEGYDGNAYVMADESGRWKPHVWADKAVALAKRYNAKILAETNRGGQMVVAVLQAAFERAAWCPPVETVKSKDGKHVRAGPAHTKYVKGRVFHVGSFPELEAQLTGYHPDQTGHGIADRLDALVMALTKIFNLGERELQLRPTRKPEVFR